jgi:hypothetical protein
MALPMMFRSVETMPSVEVGQAGPAGQVTVRRIGQVVDPARYIRCLSRTPCVLAQPGRYFRG